jgi:hypothetical protein
MKKLIAASTSLLLLACTSTTQGQHRAARGDYRSRMERCSGSPTRVITPLRPGQDYPDSGVEFVGRNGRLESSNIDDCPADVAPADGGPGPDAGAGK